ncbi:GNAT family N-acetyltransferase [Mammaliicoccus sciuri]|uniref:GNAT family N-acetyltransferase n=2 Tax=Mammaliicoccus sciuri TaxID=1296 RepID=UPI0019534226|nr:GNAT family N-acetyltransferase [Mammaliicoccus sciuri]MCJ0920435.1 GNAT family N-acetyltransferase [Mammaliicoccus sciuri]MCJ0958210.1 GNAT family N-acetyltransferase [Mammaliicoccus sciuri]MCJ0963132.1 GNAT family N-acetyltransferase [Mammaliicoccus sciuri]MCJ1763648.1 GNAT family N-acetyltransferase [Mammaliicoccus sciuri]MCJ1772431.1 GNAT family N-acetyltransferase [Mammaliicoccus sciuri]
MGETSLRKATRSDIQHINQLTEMAKSIMENDQNPQWDHRYPLEKHFYEDIDNGDLYLYEENNDIAGYICVNQVQAEWYKQFDWPANTDGAYVIHRMATNPEYKGIAMKMMQFAIDIATEAGTPIIITDTFSLNKRAQRLFEKFDFIKMGEYETDEFPFDKNAPFYAYYKLIENEEK